MLLCCCRAVSGCCRCCRQQRLRFAPWNPYPPLLLPLLLLLLLLLLLGCTTVSHLPFGGFAWFNSATRTPRPPMRAWGEAESPTLARGDAGSLNYPPRYAEGVAARGRGVVETLAPLHPSSSSRDHYGLCFNKFQGFAGCNSANPQHTVGDNFAAPERSVPVSV